MAENINSYEYGILRDIRKTIEEITGDEYITPTAKIAFQDLGKYINLRGGIRSIAIGARKQQIVSENEILDDKNKFKSYQTLKEHFNFLNQRVVFKNKQSTDEFFKEVLNKTITYSKSNNLSASPMSQEKMNAITSAKANGAVFIDIETLGSGDITEIYAGLFSPDKAGEIKVDGNIETNAIYGIDDKSSAAYKRIIDKYYNNKRLASDESVVIDRLKRMASKDSIIDSDSGIPNYISFGSEKSDDYNTITKLQMYKQVDLLKDIRKNAMSDLVTVQFDNKEYNVTRAESSLLNVLHHAKTNNLAVVAHNGDRFDYPRIDSWFSNTNKVSSDAARAYRELGLSMSKQNTLDPLSLIHNIYSNSELNSSVANNPTLAKALGRYNTTQNTVSGLLAQVGETSLLDTDDVAHLAKVDVQRSAVGFLNFLNNNLDRINSFVSQTDSIAAGSDNRFGQLFIARNSNAINDAGGGIGGISFTYDAYDGKIRHFDGLQNDLNNNSVDKQFRTFPFKKDVAYAVLGLEAFTPDDKWREAVGVLNENLDTDELYVLTMMQAKANNSEITNLRSISPITYIGTKNSVEALLSDHMNYVGQYTEDIALSSDKTSGLLKELVIDTTKVESDYDSHSLSEMLRRSDNVSATSSARNWVEKDSYSSTSRMLRLLDDVREEFEARANDDDMKSVATIENVLNDLIQDSIAKGHTGLNNIPKPKFAVEKKNNVLFDDLSYNGFSSNFKNRVLTSHTVDNAMASFGYYNNMAPILYKIKEAVDSKNVGYEARDYYFKNYLEGVVSRIVTPDDLVQTELTEEMKNKAYYDLTETYNNTHSFKSTPNAFSDGRKVLAIDLADDTNQYIGSTLSNIYNTSDTPRGRVIAIKRFISDNHLSPYMPSGYREIDNEQYLQENLRKSFRAARKVDSNAFFDRDLALRATKFDVSEKIAERIRSGIVDLDNILESVIKETPDVIPTFNRAKDGEVPSVNVRRYVEDSLEILTGNTKWLRDENRDNVSQKLQKYGYDSNTIDNIIKGAHVRNKDTETLLYGVFTDITKRGLAIRVNQDKGIIEVLDRDGNVKDLTNSLPIDLFDKRLGSSYTRIGKQTLANPLSLWKDGTELALTSTLSKAMKGLSYYLGGSRKDTDTDEDAIMNINLYLKHIREEMSVFATNFMDGEEAQLTRRLDISDIVKNLGLMLDNRYFTGDIPSEISDFISSTRNKLSSGEKLTDNEIKFLTTHVKEILSNLDLSKVKNADDRQFLENAFKHINMKMHNVDKDMVNITEEHLDAFSSYTQDKRGVYNVGNRALSLDVENLARMNTFIRSNDDVVYGSGINTSQGFAYEHPESPLDLDRPNKRNIEHAIRVNRLTLSTSGLNKLIESDKAQRYLDIHLGHTGHKDAVISHLEGIFLDENGVVVDPRILALGRSNSVQKIDLKDIIKYSKKDDAASRVFKGFIDSIKIMADGIHIDDFSHSSVYVKEGQTLGISRNYLQGTEEHTAIRNGMLEMKFITKNGKEISDADEVRQILEKHKESISKTLEINEVNDDAHRTLKLYGAISDVLNDNFRIQFHLTEVDAQGYRKIIESSEKGMASGLLVGLGERDDRINQVFSETRRLKSVLGQQYTSKFLMTAADKEHGDFWKMLSSMNRKEAEKVHKKIEEVFASDNRDAFENFTSALLTEQRHDYDVLTGLLKHTGIVNRDEDIHLIANSLQYRMKHGEAEGLLSPTINTAVEDTIAAGSLNRREAVEHIVKTINNGDIFFNVNNKGERVAVSSPLSITDRDEILMSDEAIKANIDINKFQDFVDNNVDVKNRRRLAEGVQAETIVSTLKFAADENRGSDKFKYTLRLDANLRQQFYDEDVLSKSHEALAKIYGEDRADSKFNKIFGHVASSSNGNINILEGHEQESINKDIAEYLYDNVVAGGKDATFIKYNRRGYAKANSNLLINSSGNVNRSAIERLIDSGIDNRFVDRLIENFKGQRNVSVDYASSHYSSMTYSLAKDFNDYMRSEGKLSQSEIESRLGKMIGNEDYGAGFKMIKAKDLDVETGYNNNNPNSIFGKPMVIDMGDKFDLQDRYVAVGYDTPKTLDDDKAIELRKTIASNVTNLYNKANRYDEAVSFENGRIDSAKENVIIAKNILMDSIDARAYSKKGVYAEANSVYLDNSGRFKGSIVRLNSTIGDNTSNSLFERAMLDDGVSLSSAMKNGVEVNAAFVNDDFINRVYEKDIRQIGRLFKDGNIELDEFKDLLKTEGTAGVGLRYPTNYTGSITSTRIYLNEQLESDRAQFTESMAKAMKLDMDGDSNYVHVMKLSATISKNGGSDDDISSIRMNIDETTAKYLQRNGYDVEFDDRKLFDSARGSSIAHTVSGLSSYAKEISEAVQNYDLYKEGSEDISSYDLNKMSKGIGNAIFDRDRGVIYSGSYAPEQREYWSNIFNDLSGSQSTLFKNVGGLDLSYEQMTNSEIIQERGMKLLEEATENGVASNDIELISNALGYGFNSARESEEIISKLSKNSTGLVNYHTNRVRALGAHMRAAGAVPDFKESDNLLVNKVIQGIDDSFQASKNAGASMESQVDVIGSAISKYLNIGLEYRGVRHRNREEFYSSLMDEDKINIFDMKELRQANNEIITSYMDALDSGTHTQEALAEMRTAAQQEVRNAFDALLPEDYVLNKEYGESMRVAYADKARNLTLQTPKELYESDDDILSRYIKSVDSFSEKVLDGEGVASVEKMGYKMIRDTSNDKISDGFSDTKRYDRFADYEKKPENFVGDIPEKSGTVLEGALDSMKKLKKSSGALVGIGLAAGIMGAGFIGGNPSAPTQHIAQERQQYTNGESSYVTPAYDNSAAVNQAVPQGYVVHVNGNTSEGREIAQNIINQAFTSTFNSQSVSMTMNIRHDQGNISNRDILQHITDLL